MNSVSLRAHGTDASYVRGCRCDECRAAHARYSAAHRKAHPKPDAGYVSADRARAHLQFLAAHGIGLKAINVATDIVVPIITGIRNGTRKRLQKRTEKKILAVTTDMALDRTLIDAGATWRRINEMLASGTRKCDILAALGRQGPLSRLGRTHVTVRTASLIERLHQRLSAVLPDNVVVLARPPRSEPPVVANTIPQRQSALPCRISA